MKILVASTAVYLPQHYSGANASMEQLCRSFLARGHKVCVLAALGPEGWLAFLSRIKCQINRRLAGCKVSRDTSRGYPVWRAWCPWEAMDYVVGKERPDVIVVAAGEVVRMALAAQETGTPVCMSLTDAEFQQHGGAFEKLGLIPCVANSRFTAETYGKKCGVTPHVIFPLINIEKYKTVSTRENVTFINPHPVKGRDIVLEIAKRCPDIPFAFYRAWVLSPEQENELTQKLAELPNVTFSGPHKDMKDIYGKCKILLVPSLWQETYGRVVTEAQISGIPVIASNRGGLPEAVGAGGILLDPDHPIDDWVEAVRKLWRDDKYYAELSATALAHAQRSENTLSYKIDMWEKILTAAADSLDRNKT